jgi:hypothetical protein
MDLPCPLGREYSGGRGRGWSLRPDRFSGDPGGAAVWPNAMLAEQAAEAIVLAVQLPVFRDDGLNAYVGYQFRVGMARSRFVAMT